MTTTAPTPTLTDYLATPLRLGDPDVAGPLAVFPLFGPEPRLAYRSFAQAAPLGATVTETPGGASVNDLVVANPTDLPVLLYEGEEVLGAQQNRTFDVSVLVPAGAKRTVPVSCVEHGRWDGRRHGEAMAPAPQAAYPELRRQKSAALRARAAQGLDLRADQGEVWEEVAAKAHRSGVASPTDAMHDVYEQHRSASATSSARSNCTTARSVRSRPSPAAAWSSTTSAGPTSSPPCTGRCSRATRSTRWRRRRIGPCRGTTRRRSSPGCSPRG
jgi:hypothetical protein